MLKKNTENPCGEWRNSSRHTFKLFLEFFDIFCEDSISGNLLVLISGIDEKAICMLHIQVDLSAITLSCIKQL